MSQLDLDDGGRLHYEVVGSGPPLLLVPGLSGRAEFWDPVVPALAARFTVILHDHRGTGRSSIERIDYSIAQMTGDVIALLDHLGFDRAHLIGHSTGGAIGQTLAIDFPVRLDRLVLSATWAAADAYFRQFFALRADTLRQAGRAMYLRHGALVLSPPWWVRDHAGVAEVSEAAAASQIPDPQVVLARIAAILRHDRAGDLHRVAAPTLVIGALDDMVTPAYLSDDLVRAIPGAERLMLADGGHFFPVTRAEEFIDAVLRFLDGGPPQASGAP
jgi:aminoacrylate hydrolase